MLTETITRSEARATIRAAKGSDDRAIANACRLLNSVKLTVDQFDRGLQVYDAALASKSERRDGKVWDDAAYALAAFCEREGMLPADVAAEAIIIRRGPILEALCEARFDIKTEDPKLYEECVTRTIHQGYFRFLEANEIDENGEVIPLPF